MKSFGRFVFYFLLLAVMVFWTVFTVENPDSMVLSFLAWQSPSLPTALWFLVAFVIGGICGIFLCASGYMHGRAKQRQLQLELDRSQDALSRSSESSAPAGSSNVVADRPMSVVQQNEQTH